RADRGDGVRRARRRDRVAGYARNRSPRSERPARRSPRTGGRGGRARPRAARSSAARSAARRRTRIGPAVRRAGRGGGVHEVVPKTGLMNTTAMTGLASARRAAVLPAQVWRWAIAGGAAIGIVYALSPLTAVVGVLLVPIVRWALRDLPPRQRRWTLALLLAAVALRVLVIAALFATANRNAGSFRAFFGDEEFFLVRGLRLYTMWMGQGISTESFDYAYDKTG